MSNIVKVSEGYGNKLGNTFSTFRNAKYVSGAKDFLNQTV